MPKKSKLEESKSKPTSQNRAHIAAADEDDSDPEPFRPGVANMVKESMQAPRGVWYLDSCASRYLTNNRDLFITELRPKSLDFTTAGGQVLRAKGIENVAIPLVDGTSIKLRNVTYAPDCDANLISLGQLRDSDIQYIDNPKAMTLM